MVYTRNTLVSGPVRAEFEEEKERERESRGRLILMRARREKRKLPSYRRRVGFIIALVGGEDTRGALNDANSDLSIEGVTVLCGIDTRFQREIFWRKAVSLSLSVAYTRAETLSAC